MSCQSDPCKVLIVDDCELDRLISRKAVKTICAVEEIKTFDHPEQALLYLYNTHIRGNMPELIIVDKNMPAINGFDFIEEYKKINPGLFHVKIVLVSNDFSEIDLVKIKSNPSIFSSFLKPITKEIMVALQINSMQKP
ncbi:MAG: response regulator [Bacteroidetes bacterium]|nr:MAG: response regulator [Bacteroidota bacterium]REK06488.1 MAG: response regulator [Bacteroidota bacterium]REK33254.1 MAG: response regulator [Bacteroidota bacterium]REK47091.1 MAG: response regulator [Bacteroidota bacterium]